MTVLCVHQKTVKTFTKTSAKKHSKYSKSSGNKTSTGNRFLLSFIKCELFLFVISVILVLWISVCDIFECETISTIVFLSLKKYTLCIFRGFHSLVSYGFHRLFSGVCLGKNIKNLKFAKKNCLFKFTHFFVLVFSNFQCFSFSIFLLIELNLKKNLKVACEKQNSLWEKF